MCYHKCICLVLLVGIPGSGKSFFRTFLENYFAANVKSGMGTVLLCSFCYDDFCNVKYPNNGNGKNIRWKTQRLEIQKIVQNLIIELKENASTRLNLPFPGISIVNGNIENPDCILILIDDNMYYRSMRYEYFKLAKTYHVGFCQFFFDVTLHEALKCNKRRISESQVPDSVIENMSLKIEPPRKNHPWETNSLFISHYTDFENESVLKNIFTCLKKALENPIISSKEYLEEEHNITSSNALHQIDNILKQLVGVCIKNKIKENNDKIHVISQYYSYRRFTMLKQIKSGNIILPVDLNEAVSLEKIDLIKSILSNLLQK